MLRTLQFRIRARQRRMGMCLIMIRRGLVSISLQTFAALCNITAFENVAAGKALMDMQAVFKFVPTIYAKLVAGY